MLRWLPVPFIYKHFDFVQPYRNNTHACNPVATHVALIFFKVAGILEQSHELGLQLCIIPALFVLAQLTISLSYRKAVHGQFANTSKNTIQITLIQKQTIYFHLEIYKFITI